MGGEVLSYTHYKPQSIRTILSCNVHAPVIRIPPASQVPRLFAYEKCEEKGWDRGWNPTLRIYLHYIYNPPLTEMT